MQAVSVRRTRSPRWERVKWFSRSRVRSVADHPRSEPTARAQGTVGRREWRWVGAS